MKIQEFQNKNLKKNLIAYFPCLQNTKMKNL